MMDQKHKGRLILLTIIGLPVTMILAASWLWFFVARGELDLVGMLGTANRGQLVQPPRQLMDGRVLDPRGAGLLAADLDPGWTLLVPLEGGRCDQTCENNLYTTRQIHVAMGKEFNRIRRYWVGDTPLSDTRLTVPTLSDGGPAPAGFPALLAEEHRGLRPYEVSPEVFASLFPEHLEDHTTWYLVDPGGWVMMAYNGDIHYRDVMADLKFLLKNSNE